MKDQASDKELFNNKEANQFELHFDEGPALIEYVIRDNKIHLTHTEVPQSLKGKGVAGVLVEKVLQYIKEKEMILVPMCSYVARYVDNNPQWHSLLSDGYQM